MRLKNEVVRGLHLPFLHKSALEVAAGGAPHPPSSFRAPPPALNFIDSSFYFSSTNFRYRPFVIELQDALGNTNSAPPSASTGGEDALRLINYQLVRYKIFKRILNLDS